ncbi:MAG: ABC transporter ATP-binding protein [Propionibacteriaceae bacterium]|jgi:molybdate transport system ATP-binding protein|nr:ABC transporter ATP-binding protein [Propionibacteriaceae bacterium]
MSPDTRVGRPPTRTCAAASWDIEVSRGAFTLRSQARVEQGERVGVIGPNGSGKSTLLALIAGHLGADTGQAHIGDRLVDGGRGHRRAWVPPHRRQVGWLGAEGLVFEHLSVRANVEYPLRCAHLSRTEVADRGQQTLDRFHLVDVAERRAGHLSTGQQCRTALARAFVAEPRVLLLDEPFRGLDVQVAAQMRHVVDQMAAACQTTLILVSHDLIDLTVLTSRLIVLEAGQTMDDGATRQVLARPRSPFVADLGAVTLLPGVADSDGIATSLGRLPAAIDATWGRFAPGTIVEVVIASSAIKIGNGGFEWVIRVDEVFPSPTGMVVATRPSATTAGLDPRGGADLSPATEDRLRPTLDPCAAADLRLHLPWTTPFDSPPRPGDRLRVGIDPAGVSVHQASARAPLRQVVAKRQRRLRHTGMSRRSGDHGPSHDVRAEDRPPQPSTDGTRLVIDSPGAPRTQMGSRLADHSEQQADKHG